jgi:tetratricopeptide (TPR) repeat protein
MYRRSGQPEEAIKAFDTAIAIDPTHQISRTNKGIVLLFDLKDTQAAIAAWEELLKINPSATVANGDLIKDIIAQLQQDAAAPAKGEGT